MKIGNLQTQPWYVRLAIFGGVAIALYMGFFYFVTRGTRKETKELNVKIAELLPRNAQAQIAQQRLSDFRKVYQARQEEYAELKALLPEQRELTVVLQGVQDRAHNTSLSVQKFLPKDDVQQDFYSGKNIQVDLTSSFANLRSFFDQMAHYQRIVSITNFNITQMANTVEAAKDLSAGKTVNATFDMTAYYVSAEKLQKQAPPKPAGVGQATAPAPGAQPK
ncbi:MAG: Pilus assembly protein PilO [Acidobacteria bacterium]|nr:Pilus assembly protein PilO [Acidobacteriota bacterium]